MCFVSFFGMFSSVLCTLEVFSGIFTDSFLGMFFLVFSSVLF